MGDKVCVLGVSILPRHVVCPESCNVYSNSYQSRVQTSISSVDFHFLTFVSVYDTKNMCMV